MQEMSEARTLFIVRPLLTLFPIAFNCFPPLDREVFILNDLASSFNMQTKIMQG